MCICVCAQRERKFILKIQVGFMRHRAWRGVGGRSTGCCLGCLGNVCCGCCRVMPLSAAGFAAHRLSPPSVCVHVRKRVRTCDGCTLRWQNVLYKHIRVATFLSCSCFAVCSFLVCSSCRALSVWASCTHGHTHARMHAWTHGHKHTTGNVCRMYVQRQGSHRDVCAVCIRPETHTSGRE